MGRSSACKQQAVYRCWECAVPSIYRDLTSRTMATPRMHSGVSAEGCSRRAAGGWSAPLLASAARCCSSAAAHNWQARDTSGSSGGNMRGSSGSCSRPPGLQGGGEGRGGRQMDRGWLDRCGCVRAMTAVTAVLCARLVASNTRGRAYARLCWQCGSAVRAIYGEEQAMRRAPGRRRRPRLLVRGVHAGELGWWSLARVGWGWQTGRRGAAQCCRVLTGNHIPGVAWVQRRRR